MRRSVGASEPVGGGHGGASVPRVGVEVVLEVADDAGDLEADGDDDVLGGHELEDAHDLVLGDVARRLGQQRQARRGVHALELRQREHAVGGDLEGADGAVAAGAQEQHAGVLVEQRDEGGRGGVEVRGGHALAHVPGVPQRVAAALRARVAHGEQQVVRVRPHDGARLHAAVVLDLHGARGGAGVEHAQLLVLRVRRQPVAQRGPRHGGDQPLVGVGELQHHLGGVDVRQLGRLGGVDRQHGVRREGVPVHQGHALRGVGLNRLNWFLF